jgi:CheY-like chemotaxis protein
MDIARIHILVVDDMVDAADSTVELLSYWGYDAVACYSGATAL